MRAWLLNLHIFLALPAVLLVPQPLAAQDEPPAGPPPLTISYVDGRVDVARASGVEAAQAPDVLDDGDRLITADGRAELVYADGSVVHVDRGTELSIDPGGRLRLVRGHVIVRTSAAADGAREVATPAGPVTLDPRGEYDLVADDLAGDTVVATIRGHATMMLPSGDIPVSNEDVLRLDPRDLHPRWARAHRMPSAFADWAAGRMNEMSRAVRAQPLPAELSPYAPMLEAYGHWDTMAPYGAVWYPNAVGWRPYQRGSWRHTRYGWTWIDTDRWAWPVHHFGRWGRGRGGAWYWIPQRTWGPAWVGWAVEANYVGWSPLGWNSRPVVDFFIGARVGPVDVWASSWSVIPRNRFGVRGPVGRYAYDVRRLPGPVLGGFVTQARGPRGPDWGYATSRSSGRRGGYVAPLPARPRDGQRDVRAGSPMRPGIQGGGGTIRPRDDGGQSGTRASQGPGAGVRARPPGNDVARSSPSLRPRTEVTGTERPWRSAGRPGDAPPRTPPATPRAERTPDGGRARGYTRDGRDAGRGAPPPTAGGREYGVRSAPRSDPPRARDAAPRSRDASPSSRGGTQGGERARARAGQGSADRASGQGQGGRPRSR